MNQLVIKKRDELSKKKKGFTLVELIIVIAIIAILSAIAIPKFAEIREDANVKADIATAKSIQSAVAVAVTNDQEGFELGADSTHPNSVTDDNLKSVLNGGAIPEVKSKEAKAVNDGKFTAEIDQNGNVIVKASKLQVLPKADKTVGNPYSN